MLVVLFIKNRTIIGSLFACLLAMYNVSFQILLRCDCCCCCSCARTAAARSRLPVVVAVAEAAETSLRAAAHSLSSSRTTVPSPARAEAVAAVAAAAAPPALSTTAPAAGSTGVYSDAAFSGDHRLTSVGVFVVAPLSVQWAWW